jgi:putative endonuclease
MRTQDRGALGRAGEEATVAAYEARGFHLLARNWRCALGELDLVVHRRGLLVFCEVKTRGGSSFGGGFDAVTREKRRKLRRLAEAYLLAERPPHTDVRFDVASAEVRQQTIAVQLYEDAF